MLVIRLMPTGRKGRISYRVVVSEKRSKLVGKTVDDLGFYNTDITPPVVSIDRKKVDAWTAKGALVSNSVKALLETK